jgi:NAD(P)-dependent dehydrogenase (short-subunit alcohol dehydrogenase family)
MQIKESLAIAIVTGAGSGIGRALAESFAVAMPADASVDADIRAMIGLAATEFGPVDIYVANAGVGGPPGLGTSARDWDHVLDVDVRAHIRTAAGLVTGWSERGSGYFVSVASAAGSAHSARGRWVRGEQARRRRLRRMAGNHIRRQRDRRRLRLPHGGQHRTAEFVATLT